ASPAPAILRAWCRPASRRAVRFQGGIPNPSFRCTFGALAGKELVELGVRYHAGKTVELALLGDFGRRLDEGIHGDARQRAADADAAYAHAGKVFDGEAERAAVEKVDRLAADRLHCRLDVFARLNARRIKTIRSGVGKGFEPADRLVDVGPVLDEAFGAGGEHHLAAGLVDRRARSLDAGESQIEIVQRIGIIAGKVLDR